MHAKCEKCSFWSFQNFCERRMFHNALFLSLDFGIKLQPYDVLLDPNLNPSSSSWDKKLVCFSQMLLTILQIQNNEAIESEQKHQSLWTGTSPKCGRWFEFFLAAVIVECHESQKNWPPGLAVIPSLQRWYFYRLVSDNCEAKYFSEHGV